MLSPTVARGSSDEYGSWKTICISRRRARSCAPLAASRSRPSNSSDPASASSSRSSIRPRVVFPQPDSPTTPSASPAYTSRSTRSTARTFPATRPKAPDCTGYSLTSPLASIMTGPSGTARDLPALPARQLDGRPVLGLLRVAVDEAPHLVPGLDIDQCGHGLGAPGQPE